MAARPGTGMVTPIAAYANLPPGTGMHRPVTQQGLSGVRTQSRMGTAIGGRQVLDKTYYIALLNNHLQSLEAEISSLLNELDKTEKGQQNLLFYEQRAEEQANELKELQGELSDLNLIIDRQNTNSDLRDLEFEVAEAEKVNSELTGAVEDLFKERQEKEDFTRQLEGKIHAAKDRGLKGEFEQVQAETEELRQSLDEKHRELDELNKTKEELDLALANSSLKQQAMVLEEQINELEEKRNSIIKELRSEESPEEQRQNLIQRIQKDNEEIAHMQTQLQEMNERMTQAQEELREFQNEFEILAVDKSERFRELKNRDAYMDTFLDQFSTLDAEVEDRINKLSNEIVRLLNLMSLNCRHTEITANITGLDESIFSNSFSNPGASASELQDLHVRLQEELISLQMTESRLHTELDAMHRKQVEIEQSLENFDNQEKMKEEMDDKRKVLEEQRSSLRKQYSEKESENTQIAQQVESVERLLSQSALYPKVFECVVAYFKYVFVQLKELKKRVEVAEDERLALKQKLDAQIAKNDYEPLKQQALRLRNDYNTLLCAKHSSSTLH
ncbi:intraflagellar transport protein 74 like protein [Ditylenchus destructor]|nr:intraflagellar transport protein 74 like protein [Ditylenchus destructor]